VGGFTNLGRFSTKKLSLPILEQMQRNGALPRSPNPGIDSSKGPVLEQLSTLEFPRFDGKAVFVSASSSPVRSGGDLPLRVSSILN